MPLHSLGSDAASLAGRGSKGFGQKSTLLDVAAHGFNVREFGCLHSGGLGHKVFESARTLTGVITLHEAQAQALSAERQISLVRARRPDQGYSLRDRHKEVRREEGHAIASFPFASATVQESPFVQR